MEPAEKKAKHTIDFDPPKCNSSKLSTIEMLPVELFTGIIEYAPNVVFDLRLVIFLHLKCKTN